MKNSSPHPADITAFTRSVVISIAADGMAPAFIKGVETGDKDTVNTILRHGVEAACEKMDAFVAVYRNSPEARRAFSLSVINLITEKA
jgi:hypothetical protein